MLKMNFFGGAEEVGRSSFLVHAGNDRILLDRGVKLNPHAFSVKEGLKVDDDFDASVGYPLTLKEKFDAIILSHAHLDHSGHLPELFTWNNIIAYMTPPTLELSKMLWHDTLKIAKAEGFQAKFSKDDIEKATRFTFPLNYNREISITDNASLEFFDASHIVGAALSKLNLTDSGKDYNLVYSGDFMVQKTALFDGPNLNVGKTDFLLMEATYGYTNHPKRKEIEKKFVENINEVIANDGWVLLPSFAIGRSQEIAKILIENKVNADIYFDGMCQKAAQISFNYPNYFPDFKNYKKIFDKINWVSRDKKARQKALEKPCIIITTSGMMQGGACLAYLPKLYSDKNSAIFLTGYQVKGTPGRILLETGKFPLDNDILDVKMKVKHFDFSGHAGQNELIHSIKKINPDKIILIHGEQEVMPLFQRLVEQETGIETIVPKLGQEIVLEK